MSTVPPTIQTLTRRLIAVEAARAGQLPPHGGVHQVCEKLRVPLAKLTGVAGFHSLMARALALAAADVPALGTVRVRADGAIEGMNGDGCGPDDGTGGGDVVVAHLLGLLVTFIGEPLTLGLVRGAWPDVLMDETGSTPEGRP